jgi:hypothetical protein
MALTCAMQDRLRELEARGARVSGPERTDRAPGWRCAIELPNGRVAEATGRAEAEVAESAVLKARALWDEDPPPPRERAEEGCAPTRPAVAPLVAKPLGEPPPGTVPGGQSAGVLTGAEPALGEDAPGADPEG